MVRVCDALRRRRQRGDKTIRSDKLLISGNRTRCELKFDYLHPVVARVDDVGEKGYASAREESQG